jgi:Arc/MetJ-type ribon-helix-helix transcriptional regulator
MSAVAQDKLHGVDLTPDLANAIRRRLESGDYESDLDVIRAGLDTLETRRGRKGPACGRI